ncbi:MAG: GNAT family N-acetyltransferase [Desulfatibacillum sp.]|nr:GNAT family N-acetyltransferase [Desulfatibacillum sp.]
MSLVRFLQAPTQEEIARIVALYMGQGWWEEGKEGPELVARIVAGSHCFAVAEENGLIVGFGRAISDRASDAYVQDVLVAPEFRGKGIGRLIVRELTEKVHGDGLRWIGVIAEQGSAPFYTSLGFKEMTGAAPMLKTRK